ncbi:macro domain-containing protein [Bacillus marinisedimentorum]|uniref:macro domain-containing protein n=1 Tax=Bacillus marinisedimentorum TaxID=1821260 RepID=UPI000872A6DF|nr:macro domain-containing protein [Bacillus marinisedimentorum]
MQKLKEIVKDKDYWKNVWAVPGGLFGIATTVYTFVEFDEGFNKFYILLGLVGISILYILLDLLKNTRLKETKLIVDGSEIVVKTGDIFKFPRNIYKVIAFNEFFDTKVDDKIISKSSLNGQYLNYFYENTSDLDERIYQDQRMQNRIVEKNVERPLGGKHTRYRLGSIFKDKDFFLVAFSKFNDENEANLKLHEYANCLIHFWNEVNSLYAQQEVVVPLLGSGITRHKDFNATPHQLLEVMLWTFKISKVKFREPSKVTILLHGSHHKSINYYKLKEFEKNGI